MGHWFVYLMFLIAGLLVGGAWSMYKNGSLKGTIVVGILAAGALALALMSYSTAQ
ncbi:MULTISPECIES: hypothetical protein [Corynebacterium]|uniref:Uncharacterized protein n=2 Tax=Corynebacterium glucuronolyticum TaxID=39791 RepID=A0AAX1LCI1_9CORY|nr:MULTISPECIES: hypothetical protein [Corynebacterium]MCT1441187.1 hypothetical protein [Corynebacterium glucuronolyticum]MCT1562233.1 hypothetical protein [Corynebacterium glucuronolyticum]QQU89797.1 hypothetical protein I6I68_05030 [Corynebacterium glucuronolyticum]QRO83887.1 hypothetical protein I6J20_01965 [Corynebacterium glucuronolyticum]QRP71963.1 hypothetical protein I6J21_08210 [Corynebacterium glucuronolyticum]